MSENLCGTINSVFEYLRVLAAPCKPTVFPSPRANVPLYIDLRKQDEPQTTISDTYSRNEFVRYSGRDMHPLLCRWECFNSNQTTMSKPNTQTRRLEEPQSMPRQQCTLLINHFACMVMDFSVASPRKCSINVVEILQVVEHGPCQYVGKRINASKSHQRLVQPPQRSSSAENWWCCVGRESC